MEEAVRECKAEVYLLGLFFFLLIILTSFLFFIIIIILFFFFLVCWENNCGFG